jgi:hypothetical protein
MQRINYDRIFAGGSLHQIHLRTITLFATRTMMELRHGSFREVSSRNGSPRVHFFGSIVNVRSSTFSPLGDLMELYFQSRIRQECSLVCELLTISVRVT